MKTNPTASLNGAAASTMNRAAERVASALASFPKAVFAAFSYFSDAFRAAYFYWYYAPERFVPVMSTR